jgi:outer membrane lipoprotein LolB
MRWMTRLLAWLFALLAITWLVGCSSLQTLPSLSSLPQTERNFHDNILIQGRFSVAYEQNNRPQSVQGRFQWQQQGQHIDIDLMSPLGQTMAKLAITPNSATIQQSGKEIKSASNITELTEQTLGWSLPVAGMRDWLQGFNRNSGHQRQIARPNENDQFDTEGWHVQYVSWQQNSMPVYPKRIDLTRTSPQLHQLSMRIIIDQWVPQ